MADSKGATFGRLAQAATGPQELLETEVAYGRAERFAALDTLVGQLAIRSLSGEVPFVIEGAQEALSTGRSAAMRLCGLDNEERLILDDQYSLDKQQARGSWSSQTKIVGRLGHLHFPHYLRTYGRFFHQSVESAGSWSISSEATPEALFVHTVMDPLFSSLYEPFSLRSGRAFPPAYDDSPEKAERSREKRRSRWQDVDSFLAALDLGVGHQLSAMRPGGGWSKLRAAEQLSAKVALADAILRGAEREGPLTLGARYRATRILPLLQRYYAKAKKDGTVLRRRALTRELETTLSGFFGGDWLALLDYLGEQPHPDEHVATALPETKLYLGPSHAAATKLGAEGVSEEQLTLIAASLFGGETSPAERRLSALARYWEAFDSLHARQESGMEPLWGLVEEYPGFVQLHAEEDDSPHRQGLYRRALPDDLLDEIDELWGSAMSSKEPARIVTEPFPHVRFADAFGPALRFWHGCALTAWFLCEGPYSRTDMSGLEHYHRRDLAELDDLGTPVDRSMFAELIAAERRLGELEPIHTEILEQEIESGVIIEASMSHGSRREGFEKLRDIVTKHRRAWAEDYLQGYLRKRVEDDVREAARVFHVKSAERGGKPPTPKQFAKTAAVPTDRWFGGDMAALYRAFGERCPVAPTHIRVLPEDVEGFVASVYAALGGVRIMTPLKSFDRASTEQYYRARSDNLNKDRLANMALQYLRLEEGLGRSPTLKEFGKRGFEYRAEEAGLGTEAEAAWDQYERIIGDALAGSVKAPGDASKYEREISRTSLGEEPSEMNRSTSRQPIDHDHVAEDPPGTFDTKTQPQPGGSQEGSWWRRLFGDRRS